MHGHGGNFALRASENEKLSMWSEFNTSGNSKGLLSKHKMTNKLTFSRHRQNPGTHCRDVRWTAKWLCKLCWERLSWLPGLLQVANGKHYEPLTLEELLREYEESVHRTWLPTGRISHCHQASAQCCLTCTIVLLKSKLKEKIDEMKSKASLSRKLSQKNGSVVRTEARDT